MSVSYVVTVYNKAAFLPAVLDSLSVERAATGGEIILVDDGSSDDSPRLLAGFAAREPWVRVLTQPNRGVAAATNRGIAAARCRYLRLVDADDVIVAGSTRRLMAALEKTASGFAYGRYQAGDVPAASFTAAPPHSHSRRVKDPLELMLIRQPFIPAATLGLTEIVKQVLPLPEDFRTSQDFALGLALARSNGFAELEDLCCVCPADSRGLSASKARMFRDSAMLAYRYGVEHRWPGRYRRLAVSRGAGRARNYLRRHVPGSGSQVLALSAMAVAARVPFPWPFRYAMAYIAGVYPKDAPRER